MCDAHPIDDLRLAIDCLPVRTREAMLEGIRANEIIVGAYTDRDGGVCPMLAAHRRGGRTSFLSFARAWDRFAAARKRARRATARELRVLERNLEESLAAEHGDRRRPGLGDRRPPGEPRAAARPPRPPQRAAATGLSQAVGRADELDLGDDAAGRELQQRPDHLGDVCGVIISSAGTGSLTKSVIGVSTNAGHSAVDLMPSGASSLFIACVKPTTRALGGAVDRQPRLAALAGDRRRVDDQRVRCSAPAARSRSAHSR